MSDKKFNLKTYQKINGDEHIDMRLEQSREEAPNVINEKQLDVGRVQEKNVITEKLLEDKRTGEETEITEKRLDTHKPKFANKYRNPEAFTGDMNKLEEKRLENDPVEKEKYNPASEVASQFRWWEDVKSPDGLKLAQKKTKKIAQYEPGDLGDVYESLTETDPREESEERLKDFDEFNVTDTTDKPEVDEIDEEKEEPQEVVTNTVQIKADKDIYQPDRPDLSGIFFLFNFDPREFPRYLYNDEKSTPETVDIERKQDIINEAIDKIIEKRPELAQKLSEVKSDPRAFDFFRIDEQHGIIKAALVGEDWVPLMKDFTSTPAQVAAQRGKITSEDIAELSYEEKNIDGTSMGIGKLQLLEENIADKSPEALANMAVEFIRKAHPSLDISAESLDLSKLDTGEIVYMGSVSPEAMKNRMSAEEEFSATESQLDELEKQPEWQQMGYDSEEEWAEAEKEMQELPPEEDVPIVDLGEEGKDEWLETEEEWKERLRQMELAKKSKNSPITSAVKKK